MSVIVKGMKKPNRCESILHRCPMLDEYDDCKLQDVDKFWDFDEMYKHCPLVEIPKGSRLIDANKLKTDNPRHMDVDVPYVTEVTVEEIIDEAPTIFKED